MRQVHGADVFERRREGDSRLASGRYDDWPEADIAVSDDPGVAVSVRAADCVPILLADRRTGAVAAIHAGWKGMAAGAAMVAVRTLSSRFGTNPEDLIAAVGPSIGPCCYEVGPDLAGHFASHAQSSQWFTRDAKPHLDLWRATGDQLAGAGVPPPQIHLCALCTFDHPALFHSYRRDGRRAGRLVAAIRSAPGRTP
jgi:YfiH family protein